MMMTIIQSVGSNKKHNNLEEYYYTLSFIVQIILLPIIISIISNYLIWEFPYKRLKPNLSKPEIDTTVKEVEKETGKRKELRIRVTLHNNSKKRNAYNIDAYFEFIDKNNVIKYVREHHRPHLNSKDDLTLTIDPPIKYDAIEENGIDKVRINVSYQNKFGAIFSIHNDKQIV